MFEALQRVPQLGLRDAKSLKLSKLIFHALRNALRDFKATRNFLPDQRHVQTCPCNPSELRHLHWCFDEGITASLGKLRVQMCAKLPGL